VDPWGLFTVYVGKGVMAQLMVYLGAGGGVLLDIGFDHFDVGVTSYASIGCGAGFGYGAGYEAGLTQLSPKSGYGQDNVWGGFFGNGALGGVSVSTPYASDEDPNPWERRFPVYDAGFGLGAGGGKAGVGEGAGLYKCRQHSVTLMGSDVVRGAVSAWKWLRRRFGYAG
jgi:hypothetical protein